ncbi:MAG: sulfurtransferase [Jiangellaceae bacterium]
MDVLIDVEELGGRLAAGERIVLLDVRWQLGDAHGRAHHRDGHVKGAVYVDLDSELAGPASPQNGRHPLPDVGDLQRAARRWGIDGGELVVAYDDVGNTSAARAWWLLRWGGLDDVRLLDGGLGAWIDAGRPIEACDVTPDVGTVELYGGGLPTIDADAAALLAVDGVLLDARAAERYRGEVEPVDPRAGHIPGALSVPTTGNLAPDGRFLPPDQLRSRFAELGIDGTRRVGTYCGSGVNASHQVAALAIAGVDAALYPGSWSQWSSDPNRPAAVGEQSG